MQITAILTCAYRLTVAGLLFVLWSMGKAATYLCLDSTRKVDKNWNINVSFIIHVNFDHARAEHYPIALNVCYIE